MTRQEVKAEIWLNSGLPADMCSREPDLKKYGFYRKLNSGKYEFQAYCNAQAQHYFSIKDTRLNEIMDKLLPKGQ